MPAQSDAALSGERLSRFLKTKGASENGNPVHWKMPSATFLKEPRRLGGYLAFERSGVLLLIQPGSNDLSEVRRRGGHTSLRGTVVELPPDSRREKGPTHGIVVRSLRYRRK